MKSHKLCNIFVASQPAPEGLRRDTMRARRRERGYTLIALLVLMTVLMISLMAAAPSLRQLTQRELEKESIFRGEEVAEAIRLYISYTRQPPTSMEQLLEGVTIQGRTTKLQVLRAEAARDPLSEDGEWELIRLTDPEIGEFYRVITDYAGGIPPRTGDPMLQPFAQMIAARAGNAVINTGAVSITPPATGAANSSFEGTGPFIGVASRSQRSSVIAYYGIERHDQWVFTPLFR